MFTPGQICGVFVLCLLFVYLFLAKCLETIQNCSDNKTFRVAIENGYKPINNTFINKEDIKNELKGKHEMGN